MKCLIVNDFGPIVDITKRLLYQIDSNVDISCVSTSFEALSILSDYYDNLIVDYSLPDSTIENFLEKVLLKKYSKRIIVLCMDDKTDYISNFIRTHENTRNIVFIRKPFNKAHLINVLQR